MKRVSRYPKGLDKLQKISVSLMGVLVVLTFVGANLHALLWQQSTWLVSTVLPAVVVDLTNNKRVDLDTPTLRRNATLDEAARLKAQHMAEQEYFAHYSPDGVSPWHWFNRAGYVYAHAGENLAIHFTDSAEVVEAWMRSPAHRANIVDTKYTEIGVGTAKGTYEGYNTVYVVQLFGAPAEPANPTTPVVVESESEIAATQDDQLADIVATASALAETVAALEETPETPAAAGQPAELASPTPTAPAVATVIEEPVIDDSDTFAPQAEAVEIDAESTVADSTTTEDVVVVESTISTSSGLAIASITTPPQQQPAGSTLVAFITQPNEVLQVVYLFLAMLVIALLLFSAVFEARQLHFVQVGYSLALMLSMGALWYVHSLLTSGAVIA